MQLKRYQAGFTLVEVLIALAITSLLGVGLTMAVTQSFTVNAQSNAHMIAVTQLKNASNSLSRDIQQAHTITPSGASGFPLTLTWVKWDNTDNQVVYAIVDGGLVRSHSVDGGASVDHVVAQNIDDSTTATNCDFSSGVFNFQLTASIEHFRTATETISGSIIPRTL